MDSHSQDRQGYKQKHQLIQQICLCKVPPGSFGGAAGQNDQVNPADNGNIHAHKGNKPAAHRNKNAVYGIVWGMSLFWIGSLIPENAVRFRNIQRYDGGGGSQFRSTFRPFA